MHAGAQSGYFSVDDVRELIGQDPSPEARSIEAWARVIHVATSDGHPLLATAKIASLRARHWPREALAEDFGGEASAPIREARIDARQRLLAELPERSSARAVLGRVSTVFLSFEDALVHRLCHDEPAIPHAGDALALLKGAWMEPLTDGGWRLSPLIADLGADVAPERAQRCRQIAAAYWFSQRQLDARRLPLCFWNAYLGKEVQVLITVVEAMFRLPPGSLQSAATMLSPLAVLPTDRSLLAEQPAVASMLRLLQIVVADAVEDEAAATEAAQALLSEIDLAPNVYFRELQTSIATKTVLWLDRVWLPPPLQLEYLRRLKATVGRVMAGSFPDLRESMLASVRELPPGGDVAGALLAGVFMRIRDSTRLAQLIEALGAIDAGERAALLGSVNAVVNDLGTFIHHGWANEQIKGDDLAPALANYKRMRKRVAEWGMPQLERDFAIAESVILDEGLKDCEGSLDVIDAAIAQFGRNPALIRQKSKVLAHHGQNDAAASHMIEIEHEIGALAPFDQALALRDGAAAAAQAGRYVDALRLFRKAEAALAAKGQTYEAQRVGFVIDEALVLWDQGERGAALGRTADALDALEGLEPGGSRQQQRAHRMGRAAVGLFMRDLERFPKTARPKLVPGMGSQLESSLPVEPTALMSLADNWRLLETVEIEAGLDAGVARRSAGKQAMSRSLLIESNLANARFAEALERGDVDASVRAALASVSIFRIQVANKAGSGGTSDPAARVDAGELAPVGPDVLLADGMEEILQGRLADVILVAALSGRWTDATRGELQRAVAAHWGNRRLLDPLLEAARGALNIDATMPMPVFVVDAIRTLGNESALAPDDRLFRDLYWLSQAGNKMSRRALEPLVVTKLVTGWRHVLAAQRFMLRSPFRDVPAIEAAIAELERRGTRAAAELFFAGADAAGLDLSENWQGYLKMLQDA